MHDIKFNPKKLERLNNPIRHKEQSSDIIWEIIGHPNPNVLVDIGAGTGFYSAPFSKKMPQGRVYACDIADEMLLWMDEHICPKHPNIITLKMEENHLPLQDDVADIILMVNLHHELEEPEKMLEECKRLLNHQGIIAIVDWKKNDLPQGPPQEIRYTPEKVMEQLDSAGFSEAETHSVFKKYFIVTGKIG